uniref:Membrane-associated tyrosine- and threonine-specific cdc2-inhibitory kinase wee-1.3 n=1 Tax=Ditylenchus dipsaci TaxID=166011 RepID=A0A915DDX9_9BILA
MSDRQSTRNKFEGGFISPAKPSTPTDNQIFVDLPLSTKREKLLRGTPSRFRIPPALRLTKTAPSSNRFYSVRLHEESSTAKIVSFRSSHEMPKLSPKFNSKQEDTYLEQRFTILRQLGQGSFGEAVSVKSKDDGKMYAVKCSLDRYRNSADRSTKLKEVQRHELLPPHPNLVKFIKAWEEKGRLYIQTELCQRSLDDIARTQHEIEEPVIWQYLIDLLLAVHHLHSHDLLHVDIKPANIFVTNDGVCKLGDFGLVFDLKNDKECDAVEGDSKYLAKEVLNDKPTKAADIFSLGMTILELATDLDLPNNGVFWHELRERIIDEKYICHLSADLRRIIGCMIDPNPLLRPTAAELLNDPAIKRYKMKRWWLLAKHQIIAAALSDKIFLIVSVFILLLVVKLFYAVR